MHAYLATTCRDLGDEAFRVGGVSDHVYVVTTLPRTLSQAELIEQIKKPIFQMDQGLRGSLSSLFLWQRGCAAFSVSPSHLEAVLLYVQRQEEHHRTHTFQDDYREVLRRHNMSSTSNMCGIDGDGRVESRLQRWLIVQSQFL